MSKWKLEQWCLHATHLIRYPPDRKAVYRELRNHVNDRYESYRAQGDTEEDAAEKTLSAMGDAKEVALLLQKTHKPFLGYLYSIATALCLALLIHFAVRLFLMPVEFADPPEVNSYFSSSYIGGDEQVLYAEPKVSASTDGYTITLSKVSMWRTYLTGGDHETMEHLTFRLDVTNPRPWVKRGNIMQWIWAEDSAGTHYYAPIESGSGDPMFYGNQYVTGRFTNTYIMHLGSHLPEGVEWVDLHYTRDGRNWTLRIDLTGGNGA